MFFRCNSDEVALFVRIRGTVITRMYLVLLAYILYVSAILVLHHRVYPLGIFNNIIGVLGIIISLLLGFRTNLAHSRYNEGRKVWSNLKTTIRSIARTIWVFAPTNSTRDIVNKKSAINLLDLFCYSLKHYVREEYADAESDLQPMIQSVPKFEFHSKNNPKESMLAKFDSALACQFNPPTNIPNEIIYQLTIYARTTLANNPSLSPALWRSVNGGITTLESILGEVEALQRTPIPVCYSSHLSHAFWIYLLAMPFQILLKLSWWTIPTLAFTFFAYQGCISISNEMENPFGYDYNDLPLDDFCWTIRRELQQITATVTPGFESWTTSKTNLPLYPYDKITAEEWCSKSLDEARNMLFHLRYEANPIKRTRKEWISAARKKDAKKLNEEIAHV